MRPVLLVILDGWGSSARREGNAILLQGTPNLDRLAERFPVSQLQTSGLAVGLPEGQMGNSEVGHTNIGAGRVVYQDLVRINRAIDSGELFHDEVLRRAMHAGHGGAVHVFGLVSDGGVHSQDTHLAALVEMARREGVKRLFVHAFTDGRDTSPGAGVRYLDELEKLLAQKSSADGLHAQVATVSGRYYAMDRDKRWDRVARAYDAMVLGEGLRAPSAVEAVKQSYAKNVGDEFIEPTVIVQPDGSPRGLIRDGDSVISFNFRADRVRQMTQLLAFDDPPGWDKKWPRVSEVRRARPRLSAYTTMTEYDAKFTERGIPVAFPPDQPTDILPELVARAGARQLRCAETEKYAHVTFFFNGGRETVFPGEERILVPSPRDVKTYDLKPEMSAEEVTRQLEKRMHEFGFVLVNYANPDMVGHTGVLPAALKAVAKIDECIGRLWAAAQKCGMAMVVTADHGNIETMIDPATGEPFTAHTLNPVPIYLCDPQLTGARLRRDGILADVAPTLLQMMELPKPAAMTGKSLLQT
ncbi:MAG TPA: 2,3-bisphosphoglycerate-independent phosphoglycerate mutase [Myxococcales bacterium]|jgi:2,3-bisphosphoglycerate-independent phosphoglycerate mutase|nr:2,3-bisphosphoglycerate-independent phosphoglycerate mutase [Myxococcales bacterium]